MWFGYAKSQLCLLLFQEAMKGEARDLWGLRVVGTAGCPGDGAMWAAVVDIAKEVW